MPDEEAKPVIRTQEETDIVKDATYDLSVPILDYKNAPVPRRTKLLPKKQRYCAIYPIENELEDGEILE
jgi:hypothetical protein